jgi:hypothetical protein
MDATIDGEHLVVVWSGYLGDLSHPAPMFAVARFDRSLGLASEPTCVEARHLRSLSVASTAEGLLVAADTEHGVELHPLTADGRPRGSVQELGGFDQPTLVPRPGGAPLLIVSSAGVDAITLDGSGAPRFQINLASHASAAGQGVFTGEALLVAMSNHGRIDVLSVTEEGESGCFRFRAPERGQDPRIAWNGHGAHVTWVEPDDASGRIMWASLDRTGELIAGPVEIRGGAPLFNAAPVVAIGEQSYVLAGSDSGELLTAGHIELHRVAADGGAAAPFEVVARNPRLIERRRMHVWDASLAVVWVRGHAAEDVSEALGIALLRP